MINDDGERTYSEYESLLIYPIWKKVLILVFAGFFSLIVGFSRLVLGVHSLD